MNDKDSKLKQLCTENVYKDNVFHILGVGTEVTPRKLRRRREDIEAAHEFGGSSWTQAFPHLLGTRETPTYQEVCDAFVRIEDPEERIVSEFFWFWPSESKDSVSNALLADSKDAVKEWEKEASASGKTHLIAIHNLAVLYHLYAIDAEVQAISYGKAPPSDYHDMMCQYWDKSFEYWEQLADDDDFWDLFAERVREFNEPRLTGGFVRRFRAEFPVVFDNINAQLAASYAKMEAYTEAQRHVTYMLKTMSGLDDVQSILNVLFEPMENKVRRLLDNYDAKVKQSPEQGLEYSKSLLEETEEIRRVAVGMLTDGHKIRTGLLSDIMWACNRYQVAYGNATKDWKSCLDSLEQLKPFACTPELKETIQSNSETLKKNLEYKTLQETCWFCKERKATSMHSVPMYGDVHHEFRQVKYRRTTVQIPICPECKKKWDSSDNLGCIAWGIAVVVGFVIGLCIKPAVSLVGAFLGLLAGTLLNFIITSCMNHPLSKCIDDFPEAKKLLGHGWHFGDSPPKR